MWANLKAALLAYWQRFLSRQHPAQAGRLIIRHQRLYIRPSVYGVGYGLVALTMLVGALNYQLSLGFFFCFLLLGIAHAILLRSYANLLGMAISAGEAQAVFAGEDALFPILLHNDKTQPRLGITLQLGQGEPVQCSLLAGQSHQQLLLPLATRQRGWLSLPRFTIASSAPLGLFRCWTYAEVASQVLVYPQPEENPPPLPVGGQQGDGQQLVAAGQDDFAGLRSFQRGDALHDIAWKQSARSNELLIRQYQSPQSEQLWLSLSALTQLPLEGRLSRLCAWAMQAHAAGRSYGLELGSQQIPPGHGHAHLHQCLRALAEYAG